MPDQVNHLAIAAWTDATSDAAGWQHLAGDSTFDEPPMKTAAGLAPASGAVVIEPDGRIWVVSPSNGFGGYLHTFPKGKLDQKKGLSLRANALKEVFEAVSYTHLDVYKRQLLESNVTAIIINNFNYVYSMGDSYVYMLYKFLGINSF